MRRKPIYRKVGDANYILCYCPKCGHLQPVEEHGRDGCAICIERTPLENIPYSCRNELGTYMVRRPPLEES